MAEDAEQSSESLSTSEEFEIVCGSETSLKSDEKLNKKLSEHSKAPSSLFPMVRNSFNYVEWNKYFIFADFKQDLYNP